MNRIKQSKIIGVYEDKNRLYTLNSSTGPVFTERIIKDGKKEFREWDPNRSKIAAALTKGAKNIFIREDSVILYLGAAHGFTISYLSDIATNGFIFGVDPAPRVVRDLVFLAQDRKNIAPILADANHPEEYSDKVCQADVIVQDIAQRNQLDIFLKNVDLFLRPGGYALIAVKARSIDITRKPKSIFNEARILLDKKMKVIDYKILSPFEKDHCFIICKKK